MILIAGASSRLGRAVAHRLLTAGQPVRAGVRRPERSADLAAAGAQPVALDLRRPAGFPAALAGVETVFTAVHALTEAKPGSLEAVDVDGHIALIESARAAGVRRFVYTSALGAAHDHPSPLFRAKARVEDHLRVAGLPFVILRPAAFMDFHAHELIGKAVLAGRPAMLLGRGETRRNFVAVDDVADVAVRALTTAAHDGHTLDIGGPDNLTDVEVAQAYATAAGRPLRIRRLPPSLLRVLGALARPLHAGVANILAMPLQMEDAAGLTYAGPAQPTSLADFIAARTGDR